MQGSPMRDLTALTIADAGQLIAAKKLSPVELTRAFLDRIAEVDCKVASYLIVTDELALKQARAAESEIMAGRYRGPMHGIPYALKDNIETAGIRTTAHSRILIDNVPARDATVVCRLDKAGAVLLGKTACLEFTHGAPSPDQVWPQARNPWNIAHGFTGGSSTGSAAAVAACLATGALGTDTGGSVRNPAGFTGLAGLMPTYGRVSRNGVIPYSFTLDHVGPMCWTVEDCAVMLGTIAGFDPEDPGSVDEPVPDFTAELGRDIAGFRIGVLRAWHEAALPPQDPMRIALEAAVAKLGGLGAEIADADLGPVEDFNDVKNIIGEAEFCAVHERDLLERFGTFGESLRYKVAPGFLIRAVDYIQAQRQRRRMMQRLAAVFRNFDVLITLVTYEPSPEIAESGKPRRAIQAPNCTQPFNVTGSPSISVCTGFSPQGLPLAMQIVGKHFEESTLLRVAHAFEKATPWKATRPTV
jgi:aspartyl-tRNA(Asn)/glutamyl-tRNA(Gln) amidotransferase subunit A